MPVRHSHLLPTAAPWPAASPASASGTRSGGGAASEKWLRRAGVVRAPHGNPQCFSYPTRPVRGPEGYRTAPLRTRNGIDKTRICKNPARTSHVAVRARMGPLRPPHRLFMGCLWYLNPYGDRKLLMYALKLYGPVRGGKIRTAPHGAPWVDVQFFVKTAREQPVSSPHGAQECDVMPQSHHNLGPRTGCF